VPADVEAETRMFHGAADPADVARILLDHRDAVALPGQQIGGGEPRRPRPDDRDVDRVRPSHAHVRPEVAEAGMNEGG
jgi:hypothetical protein